MNLYRTLRSLRDRERGINPDVAWVRATRDTLLMQVRNTMPSGELAERSRTSFFRALFEQATQAVRGPALAVLSVLAVVLGGSIASVSAAERALPGDKLFTVKLITEQARLALAGTASDKVRLKAAFTTRRLEELKTIANTDVQKKEERAALATDVLKQDLDTLKQQLSDVQEDPSEGQDQVMEIAKTVDQSAVETAKVLADTKEALPLEVQERVSAVQTKAADVGMKALEVLVGAGPDSDMAVDAHASLEAHVNVVSDAIAAAKATAQTTASSSGAAAPSASASSTSSVIQALEESLATLSQLVSERRLEEAVGALKNVTTKSITTQQQVTQEALAAAASSTASGAGASVSGTANATGTVLGVTVPAATASSTKPTTSTNATSP
ncbi:MAG: hypothetical protein RL141_675 [Candidatus Parcubacteria bacterium]|jgi:hypothetical protein